MAKLGKRSWAVILLVGITGQFAWTIENMYFNVYLYNTIASDPVYIANMVAASAIAATLTALLMGTLSDRIGLAEVMDKLSPQDRQMIRLRFFGGRTQSETARVLGTTQVQISRRERKILKWMRAQLLGENLPAL